MVRSGRSIAQHLRHQLQLVVLDPHGRAVGGGVGGGLGEAPVDLDVAVPPLAVVDRLDDDVVVERPQRGVGEALVVLGDSSALSRTGYELRGRPRRSGSSSASGTPGQPIQAPLRLRSSGSSAVTRPPGLRFQAVVPSGRRSMSIGSRLATTTKSADGVRSASGAAEVVMAGRRVRRSDPQHRQQHPAFVGVGRVRGDDAAGGGRSLVRDGLQLVVAQIGGLRGHGWSSTSCLDASLTFYPRAREPRARWRRLHN